MQGIQDRAGKGPCRLGREMACWTGEGGIAIIDERIAGECEYAGSAADRCA